MWKTPGGTTLPLLLGILLGAPIVMDLRFDSSPPLVWYLYLLFAAAAAGFSVWRTRTPARVAAATALFVGSSAGVVALVVRLLLANPANNLWPVALVVYPLAAAISIALGLAAGTVARQLIDRAPHRAVRSS